MRKRILSLLLGIALIFSSLILVRAEGGVSDQELADAEWRDTDFSLVYAVSKTSHDLKNRIGGFSEAGLKKLKAKLKVKEDLDLRFPDKLINTYGGEEPVDSISYRTFANLGIKGTVTFGAHIREVDKSAFWGNPDIRKVVVEDGDKEFIFGDTAFNPVISASEELHNTVREGKEDSYSDVCDFYLKESKGNLNQLELGKRQKYVFGRAAFINCSLETLSVSDDNAITRFDNYAFFNNNLTEVKNWGQLAEGNSFPHIGFYTFAHNQFLNLQIPRRKDQGEVHISRGTFKNNPIESITVADGQGKIMIGPYSLSDTVLPKNFTISDGVTMIYGNPFADMRFSTLSLPSGIIAGSWAVNNMQGLHTLTFQGNALLESEAFYHNGLKNIDFSKITYDDMMAENLREYHQRESNPLFLYYFGCNQLKALEIPHTLKKLDRTAFKRKRKDWSKLKENPGWRAGDNRVALYRKNGNQFVTTEEPGLYDFSDQSFDYFSEYAEDHKYSYIINPVDVKMSFIDVATNAEIPGAKLKSEEYYTPSHPNQKRGKGQPGKIGDVFAFQVEIPEGYKVVSVAGKPVAGGTETFTVNLETPLLQTVFYPDEADGVNYEVGFQRATIEVKVQKGGQTSGTPFTPIEPEKPVIPNKPDMPKDPETPQKPDVPKEPATPKEPETPAEPETPKLPETPIPDVNPPLDVPNVPKKIDGTVANGTVLVIRKEDGTMLGKAVIDSENNIYTFIDDDRVPEGVATIHEDNVLEILDDVIPESGLPKTSGIPMATLSLSGICFMCLGYRIKRRK